MEEKTKSKSLRGHIKLEEKHGKRDRNGHRINSGNLLHGTTVQAYKEGRDSGRSRVRGKSLFIKKESKRQVSEK